MKHWYNSTYHKVVYAHSVSAFIAIRTSEFARHQHSFGNFRYPTGALTPPPTPQGLMIAQRMSAVAGEGLAPLFTTQTFFTICLTVDDLTPTILLHPTLFRLTYQRYWNIASVLNYTMLPPVSSCVIYFPSSSDNQGLPLTTYLTRSLMDVVPGADHRLVP